VKYSFEEIIGNNVAKYRNQIGITQADLAEKVGISPAFISKVERGKKMVKVQTLFAIAQTLNVSCDALLSQDGDLSQIENIQIENIKVLLRNQSDSFLVSIEKIIRACIKEFGQ